MRHYVFLFAGVLLFTSIAEGQKFEPFGLQGKTVTALNFYWNSLYAATENDGVYRRYVGAPDSDWVHLGVPAKKLTSIFAFHTFCPLICWKGILVGAKLNPVGEDSALIYFYQQSPDTCTKKGRWAMADSGFDRAQITQINALGGVDLCHPVALTYVTAFASAPGLIWRSKDRGKNWQRVWQDSSSNILALAATRGMSLASFDDEVWAGGYVQPGLGIRKPLILRGADSGEHWDDRSPAALPLSDECRALALDPADTSIVYAALMHAIIKTSDGGKNWRLTSLPNESVTLTAVVVNPQQPKHLLAGGIMEGNCFALFESKDGGEHWQAAFVSRALQGVSSLVFDPSDSQTVYIATLGNGIYRYAGLVVGVDATQQTPESFLLSPNFPNPVHITENTQLTFRINVQAPDRLTLRLFNVLGQEKARWQIRLSAGEQSLALPLNPEKLTAGIYFIQAEWRGQRVTRKLAVVR